MLVGVQSTSTTKNTEGVLKGWWDLSISEIQLIKNLANELGVALEMAFEPSEIRRVWTEAVDSLEQARTLLENAGEEVPQVVYTVLKVAEEE